MKILMVILSTMIMSSTFAHDNGICSFNRLCTCRKSHHEVICRGVPFLEFPSFLPDGVYQVRFFFIAYEVRIIKYKHFCFNENWIKIMSFHNRMHFKILQLKKICKIFYFFIRNFFIGKSSFLYLIYFL